MKKLVLMAAFVMSFGSLFAQTDANKLREEGNDALQAKNYEVAFTKYDAFLKETQNADSVTAFNCGICADKVKKYADAVKYFDIAIAKNYNVANAYVGKASALKDLKKDAEYIQAIQEGLKIDPSNKNLEKMFAVYYLKEGQKFQKANNLQKAEESYKQITTLNSKKWKTDALYSMGVLFFNSGATLLQKATPLATSEPDKYAKEKEVAIGEFKKAAEYLKEASTVSPEREDIKKVLTQVETSLK